MWTWHKYDPGIYEIVELDVTKHLRRETGIADLVTFRSRVHPSWMVGILDRDQLVTVDWLVWPDYSSRHPSRSDIARITHGLKVFEDRGEERKRGLRKQQAHDEFVDGAERERLEGIVGVYRHMYLKYGEIAAERWLRSMRASPNHLALYGLKTC